MTIDFGLAANRESASWVLIPPQKTEANLRLFCFPYAGGSAAMFRGWTGLVPKAVQVCPVEIPGRGRRLKEPLCSRLQPLVHAAALSLKPYLLEQPFAFFGHSLGALIGFELARYLCREYGMQAAHLFVSACRAPQLPNTDPITYDLTEAEFRQELRRLNGTPKDVLENRELMDLVIPILRADFELYETYSYRSEPPLDCPITAFGGLQDTEAGCRMLEPWRDQTTASFQLHMLPGDHFFLQSARKSFLELLARELATLV